MGHFIPAKLFKTRVEKFYLFFDPWFSLFKIKRGDTEYGIGWLPLGGYVKISGMIDESMDKEQMKRPPESWEFRSKPAWQRLIIMVGGVTVNVILGVLIYAMVLFTWGKEYLPVENAKYGIACDSVALKMGLKNGDKILSVNGEYVENLNKVPVAIILDQATSIQVERDGAKIDVPITEDDLSRIIKSKNTFISARMPCVVDSLFPDKPIASSGIKVGDRITAIEDMPVAFFDEVVVELNKHKSEVVWITVDRAGKTVKAPVYVFLSPDGRGQIGFRPQSPAKHLELKKVSYSFLAAFPAGLEEGYEKIVMQVKQLSVLFTVKDAHQSLGGFYSLGKVYDEDWDWQVFWSFTAFLSVVLAFMNILPIPALDGGHIMFLLYEMVTRRKPNEKLMEYAQYAGMLLLLTLMVYANLDWLRSRF